MEIKSRTKNIMVVSRYLAKRNQMRITFCKQLKMKFVEEGIALCIVFLLLCFVSIGCGPKDQVGTIESLELSVSLPFGGKPAESGRPIRANVKLENGSNVNATIGVTGMLDIKIGTKVRVNKQDEVWTITELLNN